MYTNQLSYCGCICIYYVQYLNSGFWPIKSLHTKAIRPFIVATSVYTKRVIKDVNDFTSKYDLHSLCKLERTICVICRHSYSLAIWSINSSKIKGFGYDVALLIHQYIDTSSDNCSDTEVHLKHQISSRSRPTCTYLY